jgi:enamine deaminase RidA (YjgF/YER057c/UK114 family)
MKRIRFVCYVCTLAAAAGLGLAAGQRLERVNPPGLSAPQTYSHIVKAGKLVFIAGQVGAAADGKLAGPGMKEQVEQALANLRTALASQGLDYSHVAKITIFTTSIAEFRAPEVAAIRQKYFGQNRPASTLVQISQLASPEYKVEVEAVAVAP